MRRRSRPEIAGTQFVVESPPNSRHHRTVTVPQGQDRPNILIARNREDVRRQHHTSRRELDLNVTNDTDNIEETSPRIPPLNRSLRTPNATVTTPANTPPSRSTCDHEMRTQLLQLQQQITVLTDKIDNLHDSSRVTPNTSRRSENLPRDLVACVHKVVAKLKEKDPPTEWTLESNNSYNDEINGEVSLAIERGVIATSAFKDADPVLLERSIRTYFKTLKARKKRASTRQMVEGDPEITNKLEESAVTAKRNQRCHNKLKARKEALRESSYSEEKKRMLMEVMKIGYMSPEESEYEEDEVSGKRCLTKFYIRKLQWRSDELTRELRSLDRKSQRAKSQRVIQMMVLREIGGFIPGTLYNYPKEAPTWALREEAQRQH